MSDEDRKHFERIFQKESEKYERDSKCGGVSESGYAYKRLHDTKMLRGKAQRTIKTLCLPGFLPLHWLPPW